MSTRRAVGMSAGTQLPRLSQLYRALERQPRAAPGEGKLAAVARAGLFEVEAAQCACVTVFHNGTPQTLLVTSEVASGAQSLQHQLGEGPDLEPVLSGNVYLSRDLGSEKRWPVFAAQLRDRLGLNALLTHRVPLSQEPDTIIGVSLYADTPDAFDGPDVWASSVVASYCAMAVATQVYRSKLTSAEHALVQNSSIGATLETLANRHETTC